MLRQDDGAPLSPDPAIGLARRLMQTALTALEQNRAVEALPSLERLRLLPGQTGIAAAMRAEALLALGRAHEADAAAAEACTAAPADPARLRLRARAHAACGRPLEALDTAAAAVMAEPRDLAALLLFATLLTEDRRFEDAVQVLAETLARWPDNPQVLLRLGVALTCAGRHDDAMATLARCEAISPAQPGLHLARAQAALGRQDLDAAIAIAREGIARAGADAPLYSTFAHALEYTGRRQEAGAAFRAAARLAPDNAYLAHLAAIADGDRPDRAGPGYVTSVFDGYAPTFEASLIALGYRVPGLVRQALLTARPALASGAARLGPVLDLGCGTGLVGVALHDLLGADLIGVDLSRGMLEEARRKGIYTALRQQDLLAALEEDGPGFDLISAADVFCYLGRLDAALAGAARRLRPDGLLVFSLERGEPGSGFALRAHGRYAHAPEMVRDGLAAAGLEPVVLRDEVLRQTLDQPVEGLLVMARRAAGKAA